MSATQDAVNKAGRKSEMVYQLSKRAKELKRDMEWAFTNNQTPVGSGAGTGTARVLAPANAWYTSNVSRGASGASATQSAGSPTTAATDGTQRALTESMMKSVIQSAYTNGGEIDLIMPGPFNKTVISSFSGNVTRTQDTEDKKLISSIDVYVSDFGEHRVVPNRFSRDRDLHLITSDLWAVAYLRPMKTVDLAQTGDAQKAMITVEYTLMCRNEAGSGIVADLTTS